ncbi:MAG: regulatory protein RecX [Deltaproteobacteria bacterium]|nr:MAG: regulatory protein RecX [Deltaproteobacteria bacterium]
MSSVDAGALRRRAVAAALNLLARRDHTSRELADKLAARGFDRDTCQAAVARCRRLGYLDDERTAEIMAGALRRRGLGVHRIRARLREKGIDGGTIDALTAVDDDPEQALAAARAVYERRRPHFERESGPLRRRAKIFRFLLSRGFRAETIHRLLAED